MLKQQEVNNVVWKAAFYSHVFSSIFLLPAGFTQFNPFLRHRYPRLHRGRAGTSKARGDIVGREAERGTLEQPQGRGGQEPDGYGSRGRG